MYISRLYPCIVFTCVRVCMHVHVLYLCTCVCIDGTFCLFVSVYMYCPFVHVYTYIYSTFLHIKSVLHICIHTYSVLHNWMVRGFFYVWQQSAVDRHVAPLGHSLCSYPLKRSSYKSSSKYIFYCLMLDRTGIIQYSTIQ